MKAAYLMVDLAAVAFPLAFSFSSRYGFGADWKKAWAAVILSAIPFLAWDMAFTRAGIWSFNPRYVLGPGFFNLPFEEALFFLCIPFSCLFIYRRFRYLPAPGPRDPIAYGILVDLGLGLLPSVCRAPQPALYLCRRRGGMPHRGHAGRLRALVWPRPAGWPSPCSTSPS